MIEFGRETCGFLPAAERREWLVTNGVGGFAMGTIAVLLTRRYHGLLIGALRPPLGRTLLLTKVDETVTYAGSQESPYQLFVNRWASGNHEPHGYRYLESFRLEGTTPVWTYALADALLEKRVWMQLGANTTYIQYFLRRSLLPITVSAKALVNYRDYHSTTSPGDWRMGIESVAGGLRISAFDGAAPFYILSESAVISPRHEWYTDYHLSVETYRSQDIVLDSHLYAGQCRFTLKAGDVVTLVASTETAPELDGVKAYAERQQYERRLIRQAGLGKKYSATNPEVAGDQTEAAADLDEDLPVSITRRFERPYLEQLVLAADQFIIRRTDPDGRDGRSVIAGYPWFGDWGRDTMIALPGLTLTTGRTEEAADILRTFARYVDQGMLPNRFPDVGDVPEYNTVDATLWYFEAIHAYLEATADTDLISDLFPVLQEIINWHVDGTRYQIRLDFEDGLIYAGQGGVQLTWMDAKVGDWVVTPRIGKPVEVNALWHNALHVMAKFARRLGKPAGRYEKLAEQARQGFSRYWINDAGYCWDVLDGPDGDDDSLRPNQLLAVSLPYSPLTYRQQRSVVDACARYLLTSTGLRSLDSSARDYIGHYGGSQHQRDAAYHQGTVWGWLMGPFVTAHLRVYADKHAARTFLRPLIHHLADHGLGTISEIFDGDAPFAPRGCPAQAWSVAEFLRVWHLLSD